MAEERIEIRADFMQLDIKNGNSEYRGNVLIRKGDVELRGDSVKISKQNGKVEQIHVRGKPARYRQGSAVQAQSERMLFEVTKDILTLNTNARLQQRDQLIESQYIRFDTGKQVLLAGSDKKQNTGSGGKQRVNIILSPTGADKTP